MPLQLTGPLGLCRYRTPIEEKEKPRFLFSSDIPYKISTCAAQLHLNLGGCSKNVVDISKYIDSFDITIKLNPLILRNQKIATSELIEKNHIYVSKSRSSDCEIGLTRSIWRFSEVWRSILSMQSINKTFVVSIRLYVDIFSVNLADTSEIRLSFHANEPINSMLWEDREMIRNLEKYIRYNLLKELEINCDISSLITDSSTILQDMPPNESYAQFRLSYANVQHEGLGVADMSSDEYYCAGSVEKQLVFYDDDHDDTGDEMKILHSDESGKCTSVADEESDSGAPYSFPLPELDIEVTSILLEHGLSELNIPQEASSSTLESGSCNKHEQTSIHSTPDYGRTGFNTSQTSPYKVPINSGKSKTSQKFVSGISERASHVLNNDEIACSSFENFCKDVSLHVAGNEDTISSPMASPIKGDVQNYVSKFTTGLRSLKKKASSSFIEHDDGTGLDFAFRDSSSPIPEYIKENEKFKFIKVGKVQKFVSMFEEHKEILSSSSSRVCTRPGSPIRRNELA